MRRRVQREDNEERLGTATNTGASEAMDVIARALEPLAPEVRLRVIRAAAILLDVDLTVSAASTPTASPEPSTEENE